MKEYNRRAAVEGRVETNYTAIEEPTSRLSLIESVHVQQGNVVILPSQKEITSQTD